MKRVNFCWECGNKLYGNHFTTKIIDGYEKVLHKECAKALETGHRTKIGDSDPEYDEVIKARAALEEKE